MQSPPVADQNENGLLSLDLTNQPIGELGKDFVVPVDIQELILTNNRLSEWPDLSQHTQLQVLNLRQNQLKNLSGLEKVSSTLVDLDVYDNSIKKMEGFEHLTDLVKLDLSFNKFRVISNLEVLVNLREIFFVQNKISEINGLDTLTNLTSLELGANRIRKISGLDKLTLLQNLWLGKNKIGKLENIQLLTNLKRLSVQSNRLTVIEGLETLVRLEELYLSHNGITTIAGLNTLTNVNTLDLAGNPIATITGIHLPLLKELWMNDCQLSNWECLELLKQECKHIETVYFERNPFSGVSDYVPRLKAMFPTLTQIDAICF